MESRSKLAIITGASSGIGAETARALAKEGYRVVLAARRADLLAALAEEIIKSGGQAEAFVVDVGQPEGCDALYSAYPEADVLINNAGFGWWGYAEDMPWDLAANMIAVNITAVAHLCLLYLPGMRARRRGHIINMGSIAGVLPNHGIAMYGASKAFVDAFNTGVYRELRGSGVHISIVMPGAIKSEFFERAKELEHGGAIPTEAMATSVEAVSRCIVGLLKHPRRYAYVPEILSLSPILERVFGGIVDLLGPLLLKKK
jgi:short-subunit dehydrogenase